MELESMDSKDWREEQEAVRPSDKEVLLGDGPRFGRAEEAVCA